jgi:hypothetical protein
MAAKRKFGGIFLLTLKRVHEFALLWYKTIYRENHISARPWNKKVVIRQPCNCTHTNSLHKELLRPSKSPRGLPLYPRLLCLD